MRSCLRILGIPCLRVPFLAVVMGALPLGMLGLGLLLYARERTGSLAVGGLAAAAFGLGNAVGLGVQGGLIDRHGQGRVLSVAGVACAAWGVLAVAVTPVVSWPGFVVVAGAGMGACVPATTGCMRVLLAGSVGDGAARTAGYALLAVLFQLAVLTGPLLTALLVAVAGPGAALSAGGLLAGGAALLFSATGASRAWRPRRDRAGRGRLGRNAGLAVLLTVTAGAGVSAGAVAVAVPAAALSLGRAADSGVLVAASAAGEVVGGLVFGAVRWRLPHDLTVLATLAASAVAVGLAAWVSGGLVPLFAALFLVGLCAGPAAVAASALLDALVPRPALTRAYTLMVAAGLLGGAAGNAVGGAAAGHLGHRSALALSACWLAVLLAGATVFRRVLGAGAAGQGSGRRAANSVRP
ncbi:MFS transporter [Streptomyces sp. NPDC049879]|uniref:MFS transporter n=1 Tax=Streptomyces sp. NPDC049879 TaxID=3365598 RepID=UPI00379BEBBF